MSRVVKDWEPDRHPRLDSFDFRRLFLKLLDELGYVIEYRLVESDSGPRSFIDAEYRVARRKE